MTVAQIEQRLQKVERAVSDLSRIIGSRPVKGWHRTHAGRFANDPVFDEIVRLGREYRQSLKPRAT
jgi:hypothetical protein